MKSLRALLLSMTLLGLMGAAACGDSEGDDVAADDVATTTTAEAAPSSEPDQPDPTEASTPATETTSPPAETTSPPAETTSPPAETSAPSPLADFEEYSVLTSTIDDLDSLTPQIETDNPNTRVILYADAGGRKKYKSIYVKRNNRLKIINIDGGGPPLYNDTI